MATPSHATESSPATILLVEDDDATRSNIRRDLAAHSYRVAEAGDADAAFHLWEVRRPDLVLLDLGLPDLDGVAVIRRLRREATTPILIISARGGEHDKIEALESGADDYVTKPFGTGELHARIRALLRRAGGPGADQAGLVRIGILSVDVGRHTVTVGGTPIRLTPREFEVLKVLVAHSGRVVTRGRLLRAVWGTAYSAESHYIHVYVSQIRRKIAEADGDDRLRDLIVAEPGVGYRVRSDEAAGYG